MDYHLTEIKIMVKQLFFTVVLLLLCSSCVSRTTYEGNSMDGSKQPIHDKKLIWFWQDDY